MLANKHCNFVTLAVLFMSLHISRLLHSLVLPHHGCSGYSQCVQLHGETSHGDGGVEGTLNGEGVVLFGREEDVSERMGMPSIQTELNSE